MESTRHHIQRLLTYFLRPEILIVIIGALLTGLVVMFGATNFGTQGQADATTVLRISTISAPGDQPRMASRTVVDSLQHDVTSGEMAAPARDGSN